MVFYISCTLHTGAQKEYIDLGPIPVLNGPANRHSILINIFESKFALKCYKTILLSFQYIELLSKCNHNTVIHCRLDLIMRARYANILHKMQSALMYELDELCKIRFKVSINCLCEHAANTIDTLCVCLEINACTPKPQIENLLYIKPTT